MIERFFGSVGGRLKNPKELLVYLLLRSMKEATLEELADAAGITQRSAVRILRSFIRRGIAREVDGRVVFSPQRFQDLKIPFGGELVEVSISVDKDMMSVGEVKIYREGEFLVSLPCIFSGGEFVVDLSGFLEVYGEVARARGAPFSVKKAYSVFRRLMEGKGDAKNVGQWEIDAALGSIIICGAIAEELNLDYILTTIDASSIPRRIGKDELESMKDKCGVELMAGYAFPLRNGEGLLLIDRAGKIFFSKKGECFFVELDLHEDARMVEVDFTELVEYYIEVAEKKKSGFSIERVMDCFFLMLEKRGKLEDYLRLVEYEDEKELLEAMYRVCMVLMRIKGKDVTAKATYPSFSGDN